jgi:glycosyltransferase involved in cell wall biosynthesis
VADDPAPLKILHVLRAPVGGLFRHVLDLAEGQSARGHAVGIVAATGGGIAGEQRLDALSPSLSLGVHRMAMSRQPGVGDLAAIRTVGRIARSLAPNVLHGHGAKGGAYARFAAARGALRVYTPHGGSLHYGGSLLGRIFAVAERAMMRRTGLILFESAFARSAFERQFGVPRCAVSVVPNGVAATEFEPVVPAGDATDLVAVGELRHLKGIDVLIEAVALLHARGRTVTATIVGEGPDGEAFRMLASQRGLAGAIRFAGFQPARRAFGMGRILVVASRAESLPYVVLEAAAAGLPMLATEVGGIPEIFGGSDTLLPPGEPEALATAIAAALDDAGTTRERAARLRDRVRERFSQDAMVAGVLDGYRGALADKFRRSH